MSSSVGPSLAEALTDAQDQQWMRYAISVAQKGTELGFRPFGAVIVNSVGVEVGRGFGTGIAQDPTRHSEIVAIKVASRRTGRPLHGCTLYSTHEPCAMCAGAMVHAKPSRVVYGSSRADLPELFKQRGYLASAILRDCSAAPVVVPGVLRDECAALFNEELDALRAASERST